MVERDLIFYCYSENVVYFSEELGYLVVERVLIFYCYSENVVYFSKELRYLVVERDLIFYCYSENVVYFSEELGYRVVERDRMLTCPSRGLNSLSWLSAKAKYKKVRITLSRILLIRYIDKLFDFNYF